MSQQHCKYKGCIGMSIWDGLTYEGFSCSYRTIQFLDLVDKVLLYIVFFLGSLRYS